MNHKFDRKDITSGNAYAEETCLYCGAVSRRYAHGFRYYRQPNGQFGPGRMSCTGRKAIVKPVPMAEEAAPAIKEVPKKEKQERLGGIRIPPGSIFDIPKDRKRERIAEREGKILDWPPHFTEEQKAAETERVRKLMEPHEARYQAEQAARNEPLARLKDAYIIINLLYQEAVAAGRMTPGRMMAGRLLYSAGYMETVKALEK